MSPLQARPQSVQREFDAVLGEVLRELWAARRLGGPARAAALAQALGSAAIRLSLTGRAEERGTGAKVALGLGGVVAATAARRLVPRTPLGMLLAATAGATSWLVSAPRVTPHRRAFAERIFAARRVWEQDRAEWLAGHITREAREAAIEALIARLVDELGAPPAAPAPASTSGVGGEGG